MADRRGYEIPCLRALSHRSISLWTLAVEDFESTYMLAVFIAYIDRGMPVLSLDRQIGSWCCRYEGFHRYFMDLDEVTPWRL